MIEKVVVSELKVGDRVGVSDSGWTPDISIRTVTKRTPTQITLDDGSRWTKYGRKVGESHSYLSSFLLSEKDAIERKSEADAKRKHQLLVQKCKDIDFKRVSDEGLVMILQVSKDYAL